MKFNPDTEKNNLWEFPSRSFACERTGRISAKEVNSVVVLLSTSCISNYHNFAIVGVLFSRGKSNIKNLNASTMKMTRMKIKSDQKGNFFAGLSLTQSAGGEGGKCPKEKLFVIGLKEREKSNPENKVFVPPPPTIALHW